MEADPFGETNELSEFRAQWQEEITTNIIRTDEEISFDLYRQASYYEREGQPFEAVRFYRRAFKLNPELEYSRQAQLNADFISYEEPQKKTLFPVDAPKQESKQDHETHLQVCLFYSIFQKLISIQRDYQKSSVHIPRWAEQFTGSLCEKPEPEVDPEDPEPAKEETNNNEGIHIGELPPEVVLHIFSFLNAISVERVASVCRLWYLLARENNLWRTICIRQWPGEQEMLAEQVQQQLMGNWRRLFIDKPRPRLDGVYISQNSYIRAGATEGSYDQPVFKIRYWRYLRFFDDGTALIICTPTPPKVVVPQLRYGSKNIKNGKESIDDATYLVMDELTISESKIFIESTKQKRTAAWESTFCFVLRLGNSYKGWHDRLIVEDYYSEKNNVKTSFAKDLVKTFKFLHVPRRIFDQEET